MSEKNRDRGEYSFANINLIGQCNYNCYFCLGKDIEDLLGKSGIKQHHKDWPNFESFLTLCKEKNIKQLYITGINTDPLLYSLLRDLIYYLRTKRDFFVGLRTNGLWAEDKISLINETNTCCGDAVGYTILSLQPYVNYAITGSPIVPSWDSILRNTIVPYRISIVVTRYNYSEIFRIIKYLSKVGNMSYIQIRKVSSDTRCKDLEIDMLMYEDLYSYAKKHFNFIKNFGGAEIYKIYGRDVVFWSPYSTTVNSINYFTDGIIVKDYFIIEGYCKAKGVKVECQPVKIADNLVSNL